MKMPKFRAKDINNNLIRSSDFRNNNVYIQFVDPINNEDINLFRTVYSNWKEENLEFLVFTKNLENFKLKSGISSKNIIIVHNNYEKLKSKFKAPLCCGTYYLVNSSGSIVNFGQTNVSYENGVKIYLKQLIKNEYFHISHFIEVNKNIKNIEWLRQLSNIIEEENKNYFIVSMFTSICESCMSGWIIRELNKIFSDRKNTVFVLCILNSSFNDDDANNLRSQLKINFPIIIADKLLSQKWNTLIQEFREGDLTNIVFTTDKSGNILRVLDRSCNSCMELFFDYIYSLRN